jgi:hypothetical protein
VSRADALYRLADVSSVLVREADLAGTLVRVLAEATAATEASAGGLLVLNAGGELELLSATSHRAGDLETWQAATGVGPCSACMDGLTAVEVTFEQAAATWPEFATQMEAAGYSHVLANPLRWQGTALGGLNLFWRGDARPDDDAAVVAQAFADALTLAVLTIRPITVDEARSRLDDALRGRVVIEQAKGVLAHGAQLSMAEAFDHLLALSERRAETLGATAQHVVETAQEGGPKAP